MLLKAPEVNIPEEDPFLNCKLGREDYALQLNRLIQDSQGGFVLAVNNPWGTGKSTFIKMWMKTIKQYQTIYYNAWENDLEKDPSISIMAALKEKLLNEGINHDKLKKSISYFGKISKSITPIIIESLVSKYIIETKDITKAIGKVTEEFNDIIFREIDDHINRKKNIINFKNELSEKIQKIKGEKIIFFIDELDRCNPHYSVKLLEAIKHLFSINNIVFVFSIDKQQLCRSIEGFFGSQKFDSNNYLLRFFDIEYSLPKPNGDNYPSFLYTVYGIKDFFENTERTKYEVLKNDGKEFINTMKFLFGNFNLSLREQEKIFSSARVALSFFKINDFTTPDLLAYLCFTKFTKENFYNDIKNLELSNENLIQIFTTQFNSIRNEEIGLPLMILSKLITNYNNTLRSNSKKSDLIIDLNNSDNILRSTIFSKEINWFRQMLSAYSVRNTSGGFSITFFTNKIDIIDNLKI